MTRRRKLRIVLVVVLAFAAYRITLHLVVRHKLNEIRAQGYPVTLEGCNGWFSWHRCAGAIARAL